MGTVICILTRKIFTGPPYLPMLEPLSFLAEQHQPYFYLESIEVMSLVSAASGIFHLLYNEVQTFTYIHIWVKLCQQQQNQPDFFFLKSEKLKKNSCTDFQTLSWNLFSHFVCTVPLRALKTHGVLSRGPWPNNLFPFNINYVMRISYGFFLSLLNATVFF